jgi:NodT family efflux transporter outer membrane factor (OMF) lipoprotein
MIQGGAMMRGHRNTNPTTLGWPRALAGVVSLLIVMLAPGGCMVGPDYVRPEVKVSDNWTRQDDPRVSTQTAVDSRWWTAFNDSALDQLIQLSYRQNLPLQIAGLRILEARARLGIAIGLQYPQTQQVFASATAVGISRNAANTAFLDRYFADYQLGFDAAWELDFWGKFRRGVESESASLMSSVADYDEALVSLTAEVARTYAVIRTFEVLIALTEENVRIQEQGLQLAESRFRNGVTTQLDVTQARTLLESTRAAIPQLQAGLTQAQNALSTLLGQPAGEVEAMLAGHEGIPTAPAEVAVGVPAELLRRRPDVRGAEYLAAAQGARIGVAKADLYPGFSLLGQLGYETSSGNQAHFHNLFDSGSLFYSFGPAVQWPILNYGRIENNIRVQDARFQQLLVNYQDTVLRAAEEVEDALTGLLNARDSTVFRQNSTDAAVRSTQIALVQYREGAVDYQRVIDTQRSLLQEETALAQARSSIATSFIALYKALGGGWELQKEPIVPGTTQVEMQKRTDWGKFLPTSPAPDTLPPPPPASGIPLLPKPDW